MSYTQVLASGFLAQGHRRCYPVKGSAGAAAMGHIVEWTQQPALASALINLAVGLISLALQRRTSTDDDTVAGGPIAVVRRAPNWLGACAGFHLLSAVLFGLAAMQPLLAGGDQASGDPGGGMSWRNPGFVDLLVICALVGISALLLANLTERLTLLAGQRSSLPLLPAALVIAIVEAILFALGRPDLGYLVSEGAWLLACILLSAGLFRLPAKLDLGAPARLWSMLTGLGFFARALIALLLLLQTAAGLLLAGTPLAGVSMPGIFALVLEHVGLAKMIAIAWTGGGLLLLALAWPVD
jgi:hypothetical protein